MSSRTLAELPPWETLVFVILAVWLLASALVQIRVPTVQKLRKYDVAHLLPHYNFFAPNPGTKDFHLLYREVSGDVNVVSRWTVVAPLHERRWWHGFWDSNRRSKKALFDLCTTLAKELDAYGSASAHVCIPYLVALSTVSALPRESTAESVQFLLMVSHGRASTEEPSVLLVSNTHTL